MANKVRALIAVGVFSIGATLMVGPVAEAATWHKEMMTELRIENPECFGRFTHRFKKTAHCLDAKRQLTLWFKPRHYGSGDSRPDPDE